MPFVMRLFLSRYLVVVVVLIYLLGAISLWGGFRTFNIRRRGDIMRRSMLMHGSFIFSSHISGLVTYGILLILVMGHRQNVSLVMNLALNIIGILISGLVYSFLGTYLFENLAISKPLSKRLSRQILFFVVPWYFLLNIV